MKKLCNIWANIYILMIMLVVPLYVENKYFNITSAKSHCFLSLSVAMLFIGIILSAIRWWKEGHGKIRLNLMDFAILGFGLVTVISCLLSDDISAAFLGTNGWGMGALTWICVVTLYFLVSRNFQYSHNIWLPIMAVNIFIVIIAMFHAAGVDVFGLHQRIAAGHEYEYLSTFGNVNWIAAYLCLLIPLTVVFVMECRKVSTKIIYLVFWAFVCMLILMCGSDSVFLGIGVCAFFAIPYICRETYRLERLGWLAAILGAAVMIYSSLPCFSQCIASLGSGLARTVINVWSGVILLAFGCVLAVVFGKFGKYIKSVVNKILSIVMEICMAVLAGRYLYNAVTCFDDSWGTYRGLIWRKSWELFCSFSLKEKLIGIGPDMLRYRYAELSDEFGQTVLVSHSEPLQYLLTMGIAGLLFWLGIWAASFICFRKSIKQGRGNIAFVFPIIAFLGQSLVNSVCTTNLAVLFIILAMLRISITAAVNDRNYRK